MLLVTVPVPSAAKTDELLLVVELRPTALKSRVDRGHTYNTALKSRVDRGHTYNTEASLFALHLCYVLPVNSCTVTSALTRRRTFLFIMCLVVRVYNSNDEWWVWPIQLPTYRPRCCGRQSFGLVTPKDYVTYVANVDQHKHTIGSMWSFFCNSGTGCGLTADNNEDIISHIQVPIVDWYARLTER